jgi:transcriptional/translational regulatory protein YebC/TACO1
VQSAEDGSIEVVCAPGDFEKLQQGFQGAKLHPEVADITMKALNEVSLRGEDGQKMKKLLDALEDLDDVQHVYSSADIEE